MERLTTNEAAAAGAVVGGVFAVMMLIMLAFYILTVIASWKIFTKAGVAGWKSLIPVYNYYVLYNIIGLSFWTWFFIPCIVASVFSSLATNAGNMQWLFSLVYLVIMIAIEIKFSICLAKSFGKGTKFIVGLVLLPNIFQLILGFGSAKYVGDYKPAN